MCALVQVCDAVHPGAHRKLFCVEPCTHRAARKDIRKKIGNRKIAIRNFSKVPDRRKLKLSRANLELIALQQAAVFFVTIGDKAARLVLHLSPLPTHSHKECTAAKNAFHLNSAPDEATTSIWLKAMMVRSDLKGNTELLKNESGVEVQRWRPEGRSPEGKSGLILLADRSASALNFALEFACGMGDTAGGYGIATRIPMRIPLCIPMRRAFQWADGARDVERRDRPRRQIFWGCESAVPFREPYA
jgi:hypothetical protein